MKSRNYDSEIAIKDYTVIRADRPSVIKGGVVIYTHKDQVIDEQDIYADTICQAAMSYNKNLNLIVIAIYRPPKAEEKSFRQCLQKIDTFCRKHATADIQMMGDLNVRFINWNTREIENRNQTKADNACAEALLDFIDTHLLSQMVTECTRKDISILDLILTNNDQAIHSVTVEKTNMSDHDIVWANLLYSKLTKIPNNYSRQIDSPLDTVNLNRADWDAIRNDLSPVDWDDALQSEDVNALYDVIKEKLVTVCTKHAPGRLTQNNNKLYIPPKRRSLLNVKKRLNSKINLCKYLARPGYEEKLKRLNKRRCLLEIDIRDSIRDEARKKEMEAIEKIKTNPRAFYSYEKRQRKTLTTIGPLLDANNKLQSDPKIMSNILQEQYKKAFSQPDSGDANQPASDTSNVPEFSDITISEEEIIKAIDELSLNSAPGPDKIPAKLLKECKKQIAPALVILWRKSLDCGQIPADLLTQTIIPIYKKENKSLPSNYRPISLTSHLIKIFERVLRSKLVHHLETYCLISNHQHGFRPNRSTLTQLLHHIHSILEILERSENADIIYLDLSKAFDKVNHNILLQKMEQMKITGKIHTWIKSFLTMRTQTVVVDGHKSNPTKVMSGVPQGTVLGPALFILYMNNMTDFVNNTILKMFADDSKLTASIKNINDREKLLEDLKALVTWTDKNSMKFNEGKFQLLQIGADDSLKLPYQHGDINISKSTNVRDLGVSVSEDLTFNHHITEMISNATKFASWLLRTFYTRTKDVMLLFLKIYLISRLEYCSPVWCPYKIKDIEQIEAVQRSFTARIENLENLDYWQRLEHLNLYSLQRRRERFAIIHSYKIYKNLAPNDINLQFHDNPRLGIQCKRLPIKAKSAKIETIRFNFFSHSAPRLFNLIPKQIKAAKSVNSFKNLLDKFLSKIPDKPPVTGYKRQNANSLCDWVGHVQQVRSQMFRDELQEQRMNDRDQHQQLNSVEAH